METLIATRRVLLFLLVCGLACEQQLAMVRGEYEGYGHKGKGKYDEHGHKGKPKGEKHGSGYKLHKGSYGDKHEPPYSHAPPPYSHEPPPYSPPYSHAPPPYSHAPPPYSHAPPPFAPPYHKPAPPYKKPSMALAVQGVVLCQDCKYVGTSYLSYGKPLPGATVKLACESNLSYQKKAIYATGVTDSHGYFFIRVPLFDFKSFPPLKSCKVYLVSSAMSSRCSTPTDINSGKSGSPLRLQKILPNRVLYTAGPLGFAPPFCRPRPPPYYNPAPAPPPHSHY